MAKAQIRWSLGTGVVDFWLDICSEDVPLIQVVPMDMETPHFLVAEFYGQEG